MHILGKILTWLVLIAAVPAILLSAKLLDIQNSWSKKVDQVREQNETQATELAKLEKELKEIREKVSIADLGWERYWVSTPQRPVNVNVVDRQSGTLTASIGTNHGVPVRTDDNGQIVTTLFAFRAVGQGTVEYIGPFQATAIRENQVQLVPQWRFRPDESTNWANGTNWHFRADVPVSHKTRIGGLRAKIEQADRSIRDKTYNVQVQEDLRQDAMQQLAVRDEQLIGPTDPPMQESLPLEFKVGLSPAIEVVEEVRNRELGELNRLRHLVKEASDRLNQLNAENDQIVKSISGPENARISSRK